LFLKRGEVETDDLGMNFSVEEGADDDVGSTEVGNGTHSYTPLHLLRIEIPGASEHIRRPCLKVRKKH
jgi:hypothetical protein